METLVSSVSLRCIIVGEKRSLTNPLQRMLCGIPGMIGPHSPHILQRLCPLLDGYGDLGVDENFYQLVEDVCRLVELDPVPWCNVGVDDGEESPVEFDRLSLIDRCRERSIYAIYTALMDQYTTVCGGSKWVCKSGQSIRYAEQLDAFFERHQMDAPRYLWLHRDPRDVAASSKRAPIGPKHPFVAARRWAKLNQLCSSYYKKYGESRMHCVKAEELLEDPKGILQGVCEFLEVDYSEAMLEFHKTKEAQRAAAVSSLWANVDKPLMTTNKNNFLEELMPEDIEIIERVTWPMMQELGYKPVLVKQEPTERYDDELVAEWEHADEKMQTERHRELSNDELRRRVQQWKLLEQILMRRSDLS